MAVSRGLLILLLALPALAQVPTPVEDLKAHDTPGDDGSGFILSWKGMPYDSVPGAVYIVEGSCGDKPFQEVERFAANLRWNSGTEGTDLKIPFWVRRALWSGGDRRHALEVKFVNDTTVSQYEHDEEGELVRDADGNKKPLSYRFRVITESPEGRAVSVVVEGQPKENLFVWKKVNNLLLILLFSGIVLFYIGRAKRNPNLFLRRIAGLDAIDEAIGRATEMGRPIYYTTGTYGMTAIQTLAATVILGQVARRVAEYDSQLRIPHRDPVVLSVCQEVVKEAYAKAGRPDAYKEDFNFFLTSDQFSYTAAVDGMMVRERPAAVFYMGYFLAEALLLAEVGASTGAIQVAGTDSASQLPFFVTACDYTLIGEELYAASAYLSRDPVLVGTLRGQDLGKLLTLAALFACAALALLKQSWVLDLVRGVS